MYEVTSAERERTSTTTEVEHGVEEEEEGQTAME